MLMTSTLEYKSYPSILQDLDRIHPTFHAHLSSDSKAHSHIVSEALQLNLGAFLAYHVWLNSLNFENVVVSEFKEYYPWPLYIIAARQERAKRVKWLTINCIA